MSKALRLGLISSFVPKKCGIATFSRDLLQGIKQGYPDSQVFIAAAQEANSSYKYDSSVVTTLKTDSPESYIKAAKIFNDLKLDAVILQHEFGLFGGTRAKFNHKGVRHDDPTGDNIFKLIDNLDTPIITTFHTVLPYPDPVRKEVTRKIAAKSLMLVVMAQDSKRILCTDYQIAEEKIVVIPHGVPEQPHKNRSAVLKSLNLSKKNYYLVITGLMSPNKGIDLVIKALPTVLKEHPNVHLLVIGQTHPSVIAHDGEKYRQSLFKMVKNLKVQSAVTFINEYLKTKELMKYLSIADVYLTPHRDPEQSVSGTLAYAVGSGLLTISTPFRYAEELLVNGRGFLVPFEDSVGISDAINRLIVDKTLKTKIKKALKTYSSEVSWPSVGLQYIKLIKDYSPKS